MLKATFNTFDRLMRRYTPDPYLFAVLLTFLVFILGLLVTHQTPQDMAIFWGNGFWSLIPFTLQMVMILITGYVVATSKPIAALLKWIASFAKSSGMAIVLTTITATLGCWLNWGFGLVIGAFMCRAMIKVVPHVNYRVLVASAYSGFLVWHGGFSGSIPLLLATPGNFSESLVGRVIPLSETLWIPLNIVAVLGLLIILPITNYFMGKNNPDLPMKISSDEETITYEKPTTPAEKIENSRIITILTVILALLYIGVTVAKGAFHLNLNTMNFMFLMLGILLHGRPSAFLKSTANAAKKVSPILIQYPFYAGIMMMMQDSGLAASISNGFVAISTQFTYPLYTFFSAGIVNFFVPSGGGQWAVQSPIVVPAAQMIGADLTKSIMAVAWGDAWTNMAQPFWVLPLLAIAGLKIRDIIGYTVTILIVSGIYLSLLFLFM